MILYGYNFLNVYSSIARNNIDTKLCSLHFKWQNCVKKDNQEMTLR